MAGAFSIVMEERKALVDKTITMMKRDGGFFHNASEWGRAALRPQNPLSKSLVTRRQQDETYAGRHGEGISRSPMVHGKTAI